MASQEPVAQQARSIVVESRTSAVTKVYDRILGELRGSGFNKDDIFAIHLAIGEAFINAVKHGNKMDLEKKVKIEYSLGPDKIEISIADEGNGFDPESVPDPRSGQNLFKPDGRGLFLMKSYMDVVKFNERGNCVYMARYKEKPPLTKTPDDSEK